MPALGGAAAQPLRFLDFLIHEPVRAVLLHGAGVPVLVPSPERYAVHKLIVASRRRIDGDRLAKAEKDRHQSLTLIKALVTTRRTQALADVYMEAWDRGAAWREAISESLAALDPSEWTDLRGAIAAAVTRLGGEASNYGVEV
ncbi:hypothetical protein LTR94_023762 [Friedmanniomyces endolithicus]|nr:hypothetical protein LTR94_023762 [Friedmanniomyces endolithicus]